MRLTTAFTGLMVSLLIVFLMVGPAAAGPPPPPAPVPALSPQLLGALAAVLGIIGLRAVRARQ
jgi:hypothetical protein